MSALIRPADCAAAAAALVSVAFEGPEAVKSFPSSDAYGNVLSEVAVDNVGLIDGFIGDGLPIAVVGLVTYRTECVIGTLFVGFCLDSKRLTREFVAPTTVSSVERDILAGLLTRLSMEFCRGDGWPEFGVELMDFCVLAGVDLEVACKAAA